MIKLSANVSKTVFNYGFLPRAMMQGAICLIDEIDGIEPSVAFSIHQLLEDQGKGARKRERVRMTLNAANI